MSLEEQIASFTNPQEFARLCNAVLTAEYGADFQVVDGTRGDGGNDGYVISEKRLVAMFCPMKQSTRNDKNYLKKIKSDLEKASRLKQSMKYEILSWTFITPGPLGNDVIVAMREMAAEHGLAANHQGATFLAGALLRYEHLIKDFPNLQVIDIGARLDEITRLLKGKRFIRGEPEEAERTGRSYEGKATKGKESEAIEQLRRGTNKTDAKRRLRAIYYSSDNTEDKINSLLGVLELYNPLEDSPEDMVALSDDGIRLAEGEESDVMRAAFTAQKGYFLSSAFALLDARTAIQIQTANMTGFQTVTEASRQRVLEKLNTLQEEFSAAFDEAIKIARKSGSLDLLASVLIMVGNAAGDRAIHFSRMAVGERANNEKQLCRRALLTAKSLYEQVGHTLGVANALHNLANHLRFFEEKDEALLLLEKVKVIAQEFGDQRMIRQASRMEATIRAGRIPDYLSGEGVE